MKRVIESDTDIFGMTNINPKRSNLPCLIWAQNRGKYRNVEHNEPYVKIEYDDSVVSVSIEKNPRILTEGSISQKNRRRINEGIKYVGRNYDLFLQHFNDKDGDFDDTDLFEALKARGDYK